MLFFEIGEVTSQEVPDIRFLGFGKPKGVPQVHSQFAAQTWGFAVLKMEDYSPPTSGRENKLRLDFNENTIGCSLKVIQALQQVDANKLSVYPEYTKFRNSKGTNR